MPALIESLVNGINPIVGGSRDDLRPGDTITLTHVGAAATTYAWSIAFAPEAKDGTPSAAVLAGIVTGPGPVSFIVDNEGAYLIRLVVDAGLATQDEQYVRLRYLTKLGDLKLVAAGERRDGTGTIPVDIDAEGWANDQNFNLQKLECLVQHVSASGRIIYVDANRGKDKTNTPNDPTVAECFADFSTISAAITAAENLGDPTFNGGVAPSADEPIIIAVRPGFYEETLELKPFVHVIGWPSNGTTYGSNPNTDRSVVVSGVDMGAGPFVVNTPNATDFCYLANVVFENNTDIANPMVKKTGDGSLYCANVEFLQNADLTADNPAFITEGGATYLDNCRVIQNDGMSVASRAFECDLAGAASSALYARNSYFEGPNVGQVDPNLQGNVTAFFATCQFNQTGTDVTAYSIRSWSEDLVFDDGCVLTRNAAGPVTTLIECNPGGLAVPGDLTLTLRRTRLGEATSGALGFLGISIDDTNVVGTSTLRLASSEYGTITETGTVVRQALTLGTSLFYNNTVSGLAAENVQDAIDELSAATVPVCVQYTRGTVNLTDATPSNTFGSVPCNAIILRSRVNVRTAATTVPSTLEVRLTAGAMNVLQTGVDANAVDLTVADVYEESTVLDTVTVEATFAGGPDNVTCDVVVEYVL
jgi:hypothetical protein